jgi:hypothetical protein
MQNGKTVATKPESRLIATAIAVSYAVAFTLLVVLVISYFGLLFKDIFDDFDVTLSGITLMLIDLGLWIAGTPEEGGQFMPGYVLVLSFIVCLLISTIVCHILFAKSKVVFVTLLTICFSLLFNIPVLLIFGFAFLVPYNKVIESL